MALLSDWLRDADGAPEWVAQVVERTKPTGDRAERYDFDWREAEKRVQFIEKYCRYPEGPKAGQRIELDEWQKNDIVRPLFGWKVRETELRRYRRLFLGIPRKNAKSTLTAAMALSIMLQDGEVSAEIYCLASNKVQADRVYRPIRRFIEMDPKLLELIKMKQGELMYKDSYVHVLAAAGGNHGKNTHAVLIDELHEFTMPKQLDALEALTSSMLAREQPLQITMTTAGADTTSVCHHEWEYSLKVQRGQLTDDTLLPVIYAADKHDDWHSEDTWRKANPGLGTILPIDGFIEEYNKAKNDPKKVNTFLRLHLNIWTLSDDGWIDDTEWMRCAAPWPEEAVKHLPMYMGIDLASTDDLCAVSMLWVDELRRKVYLKVHHFCNEDKARNKDKSHGVDYLNFHREGSLTITPGNVTDHDYIFRFIEKHVLTHRLVCIAYDRAHGLTLIPKLVDAGFRCEPFSQSIFAISEPTKQFEVAVRTRRLVHDGSQILRWQMGCVALQTNDTEQIKVKKDRKRPHRKVDGVVAAIMAYGQFMHETASPQVQVDTTVIGLDFD
jgi:phage terminase large subunit-like protein